LTTGVRNFLLTLFLKAARLRQTPARWTHNRATKQGNPLKWRAQRQRLTGLTLGGIRGREPALRDLTIAVKPSTDAMGFQGNRRENRSDRPAGVGRRGGVGVRRVVHVVYDPRNLANVKPSGRSAHRPNPLTSFVCESLG